MIIRTIEEKDFLAVDKLIRDTFSNTDHGYGNESELVDKIRLSNSYIPNLEIVATDNETIIGHGLLSEVKIVTVDGSSYVGLVLAPLDVALSHQGEGVGSRLLIELEERAQKLNYPFISILGHPDYYPKFGYVKASKFDIAAPFTVPDEAFMIKFFDEDKVKPKGTINYSDAFNE